MWAANRRKGQESIYLKSDIQSITTNVVNISNEIHGLITALAQAAGGAPSGADARLIGLCQSALQEISGSLQQLNTAYSYADQLDIMEWIDEGDTNGFY